MRIGVSKALLEIVTIAWLQPHGAVEQDPGEWTQSTRIRESYVHDYDITKG